MARVFYNLFYDKKEFLSFFLLLSIFHILSGTAQPRLLNAVYPYSSEEQNCMLIDKQGLIWIGSNAGIKSYDGYSFKTYRNDAGTPNILPNNTVISMTEGNDDVLWIGTRNGLVSMDKKTSKFITYNLPGVNNRIIYSLFTSHDGRIWIGTDGGVTCYLPDKKTFYHYSDKNTAVVDANGKRQPLKETIKAKSFAEDKAGNIYIGAWSTYIYRLDAGKSLIYKYDMSQYGKQTKSYMVKTDRAGRLWICTWGDGIKCMTQPTNQKDPGYIEIPNSQKELYYNLVEDPVSHTIWICARYGFGIINTGNIKDGISLYKSIDRHTVKNVRDIKTDGKGNIWLLTMNDGLYHVYTQPSLFKILPVIPSDSEANRIKAVFTTDGRHFWLTLAPVGFACYDAVSQQTTFNRQIPGMAQVPEAPISTHYSAIADDGKGGIWLASNGFGITALQNGKARIIDETNSGIVNDRFVNTLYRSRRGIVFAGEKNHLNYMLPSGKSFNCVEGTDVRGITEDHKGRIWAATENKGIVCVQGDFGKPKSLSIKYYNAANGKFTINDATNCLEDSKHRLWAISNGGLFKYNEKNDRFENVNKGLHWNTDRIFSIMEDCKGNLWLTTDDALVCLQMDDDGQAQYTTYTKEDGLGDLTFLTNSCYKLGDNLYFGSGRNLICFNAKTLNAHRTGRQAANIIITDLIVDGKHYNELDSTMQAKLCGVTPSYMRTLSLPATVSKFAFEFALLSYSNTAQSKYAYRLEGYDDKQWHYMDARLRQASFENIPSGNYRLHVKAADSYGKWNEMAYTIEIKVLPPWWASWWAYIIYICILLGGIRMAIVWYRERLRTQNRLQMTVVFTNIAHELLTPLTVISAAADNIRRQVPESEEQTGIIHDNVNRLTRMLRQILEVRKSQAGKLKLKVSEGKLGNFCAETVRSLMPMLTSKALSLEQRISCMDVNAWFDTDKVEKMLYNLLNNAVKYTEPGGQIVFNVSIAEQQATITVTDTGRGISKKMQRHLFNRFLDGDYRQMNTIGTGIGLSLVNDLVKLHHGKIRCESEEGKGTTFTITLPINKASYSDAEIINEESTTATDSIIMATDGYGETTASKQADNAATQETEKEYTVLIVEDNSELLGLMCSLLGTHYNVLTASDGEKAQRIIQKAPLDVVVTDVMMPVMDGIELTKWIKGDENYYQLPVVMLTAKTQDEDRNEAYRVGADAYITKPFKLKDIQLRIDSIIANRQRVRRKFQAQTDFKVEDQHYSSPDELFVQNCIDKVKAHISDSEFGREQLAATLCISSSTLYNKLRALTGMNIMGFIASIRMKEACRILKREPDIRINELAYRVGFSTPRYFSLCFKKEYGMSIREFVEQDKTKAKKT